MTFPSESYSIGLCDDFARSCCAKAGWQASRPLSHPDLTIRFVKEASVTKRTLVADKDFMDVGPRQENLTTIAGFPIMLQAPLQPCYGLTTVHRQKFASEKGLEHSIYLRTFVLHQDSQNPGDRASEILAA